MSKFYVSPSPHIKSNASTRRIMLDVIIALVPAVIASVVHFGWYPLVILATCVGVCVASEFVSRLIMKRDNTIGDLSAVVTGVLLALNLPANINPLIAAFGALAAIVVVKQMFGGLGMNFVNPALAGRIILLVSFPTAMTTWVTSNFGGVDAVTSATPLAAESGTYSYIQLLLGSHGGSMGETCAVALILGGIYLLIRKVIAPTIPLAILGSAALMSLCLGRDPLFEVLSGGLLLGAIFMATDYVTSPITFWGKIIYGVGIGIFTVLIRAFANIPEGMSFAILLFNILTPLIENITTKKPFGARSAKEGKK